MEITINIKGLEGLTSAIEKIAMGQISIPEYLAPKELQPQTQQTVPNQQPIQQIPVAQPTAPIIQQTPTTGVPITQTTYTQEQIAVAATALVEAGRLAELQQLLAGFGVQALTELSQERYGEFATALRGLGAKI